MLLLPKYEFGGTLHPTTSFRVSSNTSGAVAQPHQYGTVLADFVVVALYGVVTELTGSVRAGRVVAVIAQYLRLGAPSSPTDRSILKRRHASLSPVCSVKSKNTHTDRSAAQIPPHHISGSTSSSDPAGEDTDLYLKQWSTKTTLSFGIQPGSLQVLVKTVYAPVDAAVAPQRISLQASHSLQRESLSLDAQPLTGRLHFSPKSSQTNGTYGVSPPCPGKHAVHATVSAERESDVAMGVVASENGSSISSRVHPQAFTSAPPIYFMLMPQPSTGRPSIPVRVGCLSQLSTQKPSTVVKRAPHLVVAMPAVVGVTGVVGGVNVVRSGCVVAVDTVYWVPRHTQGLTNAKNEIINI